MTYKNEYKNDFERYVNELYDMFTCRQNEVYDNEEWIDLTDDEIHRIERCYVDASTLVECLANEYGIEVY